MNNLSYVFKTSLLLVGAALLHFTTFGQVSVNIVATGEQTSQSCDGAIDLTFDGIGSISGLSAMLPAGVVPMDFTSTATTVNLENACGGTDYGSFFEVENDSCLKIFFGQVIIGQGQGSSIGVSSVATGVNFNLEIDFQQPTTEFSSDGAITLISSDLVDADIDFFEGSYPNAGFQLLFFDLFGNSADSIGTGMSISGLNSGVYLIRITSSTEFITLGMVLEPTGTEGCANDSIQIIPIVYPAFDNVTCDGSVNVIGWGTVGPYIFEHSSGTFGAQDSLLCDGLYTVTVSDQADNETTGQYIIPALFNVVNSVNWPFDPTLDTLFSLATENCDLDFTLPIDSVLIDEVYIIDSLECQAVWRFYQAGEVYTITQDYAYDTEGPFIFTLGVFCENGRAELGYYYAVDEYDFTGAGVLALEESRIEPGFTIAPNPTNGLITLSTEFAERLELKVYDAGFIRNH